MVTYFGEAALTSLSLPSKITRNKIYYKYLYILHFYTERRGTSMYYVFPDRTCTYVCMFIYMYVYKNMTKATFLPILCKCTLCFKIFENDYGVDKNQTSDESDW